MEQALENQKQQISEREEPSWHKVVQDVHLLKAFGGEDELLMCTLPFAKISMRVGTGFGAAHNQSRSLYQHSYLKCCF
jgi:hypothetical protein